MSSASGYRHASPMMAIDFPDRAAGLAAAVSVMVPVCPVSRPSVDLPSIPLRRTPGLYACLNGGAER